MSAVVPTEPLEVLIDLVPELAGRCAELVALYEDCLRAPLVFAELAALMAQVLNDKRALDGTGAGDLVGRCCDAIERIAAHDPDDAIELVGFSVLANFTEQDLARARPWMGPCTEAVLEDLQAGILGWEDGC